MEASDRVGGRIHTYYGNGWYADLGAMRFPRDHVLLPGVRCRNSKSFKADAPVELFVLLADCGAFPNPNETFY